MLEKKYPEGHFAGKWIGIFVAIFSGVGVPLSVATDNSALIGIGPALGIALGVAVGQSIEKKYREQGKIRQITKEEKKIKKILVYVGMAIFILGLGAFLTLFLLR